MKQSWFFVWAIVTIIGNSSPVLGQARLDFNNDGITDLVTSSFDATKGRTWNIKNVSDDSAINEFSYGLETDTPFVGTWVEAGAPVLGVLQKKEDSLVWKVLQSDLSLEEQSFGSAGDTALIGADLDGNGISDGVVVHKEADKRYFWTVKLNMFSANKGASRSFRLGKEGDRIIVARGDRKREWVGVFGPSANGKSSRLELRRLQGKRTIKSSTFPLKLSQGDRPRPWGIHAPSGRDILVFMVAEEGDTRLLFYSVRGKLLLSKKYAGTGKLLIGDFLPEAGEEVLFETENKSVMLNPFSRVSQVKNGGSTVGSEVPSVQVTVFP